MHQDRRRAWARVQTLINGDRRLRPADRPLWGWGAAVTAGGAGQVAAAAGGPVDELVVWAYNQ
jgi:hypothetical protein